MFTRRMIIAELKDILGMILLAYDEKEIPKKLNELFNKKLKNISDKYGISLSTPQNTFAYSLKAIKKYLGQYSGFEDTRDATYDILSEILGSINEKDLSTKEGGFFDKFEKTIKDKKEKNDKIEDNYFLSYFYKSLRNYALNYKNKKIKHLQKEEPSEEIKDFKKRKDEPILEKNLEHFLKDDTEELEKYIKSNEKDSEKKDILLSMIEVYTDMGKENEKLNKILSEKGLEDKKIDTYEGMSKYLEYVKGIEKFQGIEPSHGRKYISRYNGDFIRYLIGFAKETNNQDLLDYLRVKSKTAPKEMQPRIKIKEEISGFKNIKNMKDIAKLKFLKTDIEDFLSDEDLNAKRLFNYLTLTEEKKKELEERLNKKYVSDLRGKKIDLDTKFGLGIVLEIGESKLREISEKLRKALIKFNNSQEEYDDDNLFKSFSKMEILPDKVSEAPAKAASAKIASVFEYFDQLLIKLGEEICLQKE